MELPDYIPAEALEWQFIRASGPGGQHVNKTSTAVVLKVATQEIRLSVASRARLAILAGKRLSANGVLTLRSQAHASQHRNRLAAIERLTALIEQAKTAPPRRIPTKVSRARKAARLDNKRKHSQKKSGRGRVDPD